MAPNNLKALISAALEGPSQSATPAALKTSGPNGNGAYDFTGGADPGSIVDGPDTAANTPSVAGDFGVTDADDGAGEGGSHPPVYAIITVTSTNMATVSGGRPTATDELTYTVTSDARIWGEITLNTATGTWVFTADAAALNSLDDGEVKILALGAQVRDAAGDSDIKTLIIRLAGAADAVTLLAYDNKITVSASERLVLNDRFINADDPDTPAASFTYTVSGAGAAMLAKLDGSGNWMAMTSGGTFTHQELLDGKISILTATAGSFTITVSDGTTTTAAATIEVAVRMPYTPPTGSVKGANHDLSGATAPAEVETGLVKRRSPALPMMIRSPAVLAMMSLIWVMAARIRSSIAWRRQMTAVSSPGMAVTRSPASPPAMISCNLEYR